MGETHGGGALAVRLEWEGKPTQVERLSLPFQTVETINESRATRERDAGSLFGRAARRALRRNQLIWGDNKLVMSSLLKEYAGQVKLIYIDPPFDTGADFSFRVQVGDADVDEGAVDPRGACLPGHLGAGTSSYLSMMLYERLVLIHELLATTARSISTVAERQPLREVALRRDLRRRRLHATRSSGSAQRSQRFGRAPALRRIHDVILLYRKVDSWTWNRPKYTPLRRGIQRAIYRHVEPETGRRYSVSTIDGPGGEAKGTLVRDLGVTRYWRYSRSGWRS